jgi:predicted MFS family arabinose efflux permease/sugar lactone lactonase YvrE
MAVAADSRRADARWITVVLAAVCAGLHVWDLPAAIPFIGHDMAITLVQAGALLGVVQVAGMAGGLAASLLAEVIGERRCLLAGLALESAGSAAGAVAPSVTALMVSRVIEGAGSILVVVTGPGLIRRHTPQPRLNTAIGWWGAFTGIATVAGLAGSALILQVASWRLLWWAVTAATMAPLPLVAVILPPDQPRGAGGSAAAGRRIGATVRSVKPWIAGLAFACFTIQWMTVIGFLPTIYQQHGLRGIWPGVLTAAVGGLSAAGSIGATPLLQRGVPARALLIPGFAAMAATSLLAFAVNWAVLPGGTILQLACVAAFSFSGAAIPATLFRIAVDLAPPAGSPPAVIGLMQQLFNAGSAAGPAIAAWLATRTGGWQSTWWMTCTFAALGGLFSLCLSERRLGITLTTDVTRPAGGIPHLWDTGVAHVLPAYDLSLPTGGNAVLCKCVIGSWRWSPAGGMFGRMRCAGCAGRSDWMPTEVVADVAGSYELPGAAVFPESIGVDAATGDAYVGSLADGTLYRLASGGMAEAWAAGGHDGRRSVAGVKVDARRRLWAAGGNDGTLWVYDLASGGLLACMSTGTRPSVVNDIAFGPHGEAYVTDSRAPVLLRADGDPLAFHRWVDLAAHGVPWPAGLNFNGIVLAPDGRHVVACQTNLGRFWHIDLGTGKVGEVALGGGPLEHCDGLAASGTALYIAVNAHHLVAVADLAEDGSAARVHTILRSDAFAFPTAVAVSGDRLLVVNGQLDKMGGRPQLPFTVLALAIPETW